ncbi:hypothetical protein A2U01_0054060 [Trifolium medium]|uniref:Uncharacterized protein n=1 Tax=Trifolium medium TaxID=97028 RepID=A0A392RAG7_9FABA|nr:hypothetical protein [Trifolium medium]
MVTPGVTDSTRGVVFDLHTARGAVLLERGVTYVGMACARRSKSGAWRMPVFL